MRLKLVFSLGLFFAASCPAAYGQTPRPCPREVPEEAATCYSDKDANGAYILAAVPKSWTGVLIVHSHGGPRMSPVEPSTNDEDLARFAVFVREGHAFVGSSYRRPGYGVGMAVEDTESARRYFLEKIVPISGPPKLVIAHGQSWGGNVTAKLIEMDAARRDMPRAYDGALLTSAVLPGGAMGYWFRSDLRAVYQYYCQNHPRPEEAQYVVATGLPAGVTMTRRELEARIDECTGVSRPASERSPAQAKALANITSVIRIEESSLVGHMSWATFLFQDLVHKRLGGKNPFSNIEVRYSGSSDDAALNAGVVRFEADAAALKAMNEDSHVQGSFAVPVLTVHAVNDPTAFVENEAAYRAIADAAGQGDKLVQVFLDERAHSKFRTPDYPAALNALLAWVQKGEKPSADGIASACEPFSRTYGEPCTFLPSFAPPAYATRIPPRP